MFSVRSPVCSAGRAWVSFLPTSPHPAPASQDAMGLREDYRQGGSDSLPHSVPSRASPEWVDQDPGNGRVSGLAREPVG